jgi:hypothetical protein
LNSDDRQGRTCEGEKTHDELYVGTSKRTGRWMNGLERIEGADQLIDSQSEYGRAYLYMSYHSAQILVNQLKSGIRNPRIKVKQWFVRTKSVTEMLCGRVISQGRVDREL